jgi:RNA recognition motif-containing protein
MNTKLYVDNLTPATTEHDLRDLFSAYGKVAATRLPPNSTNGRPRGFGFVTMVTVEGAQAAIRGLNGKAVGAGALTVSEAWPQEESGDPPSAGRTPIRSVSCLF